MCLRNFGMAAFFATALLLCGCSDADWDNALSYDTGKKTDSSAGQTAIADSSASVQAASSPPVQSTDLAPLPSTQAYAAPPSPPPPLQSAAVALPPAPKTYTAPQPSYAMTQTVTTVTSDPTMSYCRKVAQGSGAVATRDGLDDTSQMNAADTVYQACMRMYGRSGQ
jgi:protein-disulfide isomerase